MATPMTPTIHLNGSSANNLKEELIEAADALRKAMRAMELGGPNARDYYPQGEAAFGAARREHETRLARVRSVLAEYEQILHGLVDQIDARDARKTVR